MVHHFVHLWFPFAFDFLCKSGVSSFFHVFKFHVDVDNYVDDMSVINFNDCSGK